MAKVFRPTAKYFCRKLLSHFDVRLVGVDRLGVEVGVGAGVITKLRSRGFPYQQNLFNALSVAAFVDKTRDRIL
jgi:hypothetical protein